MGAIMNGMCLHGGVQPFGGTFLVFSDYMRPAIRLAALMGLPTIYVFTHDSIGLGEDGPTHQPVEHLAALRAIPGLLDLRPADGPETVEAWRAALRNRTGPSFLALTRQTVPVIDRGPGRPSAAGLHRGGYVLREAKSGRPDAVVAASGSEIGIALEAREAARRRRHRRARGERAELAPVRRAARGVQKRGAAGRCAQGVDRGGKHDGVGPMGGKRRGGDRDRPLWGFRALPGGVSSLRDHCGRGVCGGEVQGAGVPAGRRIALRCPAAGALAIAVLTAAAPSPPLAAQDTTQVMRVRGVRVEVPRPSTTAGGTSAVEIATDSLNVVAAPTAAEFLRRLPLIQMRANSRGEVQPDLRGADDRQIAVLLDGVLLTLGWDHRTDLSIVPFTAVRTVTLLRGLSSMVHGPNVLGGALELDVASGRWPQVAGDPLAGAFSLDHTGGASLGAATTALLGGEGAFTNEPSLSLSDAGWILRAGGGYRNSPGATLPGSARTDPRLDPELLANADGLRLNSDRVLADGFVSARYQHPDGAWLSTLITAVDAERGVTPEAHVADPRLWRYPDQSRTIVALSGGTAERASERGESYVHASFGLDRSSTTIDEYATPAYRTIVGARPA